MPDVSRELAALAGHLRGRRAAILKAWQRAVTHDPELTTGATLPRAQLVDHIPTLLETYECRLDPKLASSNAGAQPAQEATAAAHGLHRWQQGYNLQEVCRELGRLNECVVLELEEYAKSRPHLDHEVMATARRLWAEVSGLESSASIAEYFRLQQLEANGHISDLQRAVTELQELSRQRADLLHEAAHDLRGNMSVVMTTTAALTKTEVAEVPHYKFLKMLERNVLSLQHLLDDVLEMARLQAGKDRRRVAPFDAAQLLRELGEDMQEFARQRGLELKCDGPTPFLVEGDSVKVRRIAQNLVINAIRYTRKGSVTVSWADSAPDDPKRWMISVQDTGPGLSGGRARPLTGALEEATEFSHDSGETAHPGTAPTEKTEAPPQEGGEGIGLSIVKRLAELLDATVEVQTDEGRGTTFRVLIPRRYPGDASP